LLTDSVSILNNKAFEHQEIRSRIDFPNPPVKNFFPSAEDPNDKILRSHQMHGVAWMESRVEQGGGIIGDQIGLGKVSKGLHDCAILD
jgi:SNF2 family DNA or RNA helicase